MFSLSSCSPNQWWDDLGWPSLKKPLTSIYQHLQTKHGISAHLLSPICSWAHFNGEQNLLYTWETLNIKCDLIISPVQFNKGNFTPPTVEKMPFITTMHSLCINAWVVFSLVDNGVTEQLEAGWLDARRSVLTVSPPLVFNYRKLPNH